MLVRVKERMEVKIRREDVSPQRRLVRRNQRLGLLDLIALEFWVGK